MSGAGLDHVGIERALHQESRVLDATGGVLEHPDEQLADRLALVLGLGDPGEALEEAVLGPDVDQLDPLVAAKGLDDLLPLVLPHQPGVDEHAGQLGPDRAMDEGRGDSRIDAAGESTDRTPRSDLGTDLIDGGVDERRHRPGTREAGALAEEALEQGLAAGRVQDLGVVLHTEDAPSDVLEGGGRRLRGRRHRSCAGTVIVSKWLIHTDCRSVSVNSRPASATSSSVRPYSPRPVLATVPPRSRARSCAP